MQLSFDVRRHFTLCDTLKIGGKPISTMTHYIYKVVLVLLIGGPAVAEACSIGRPTPILPPLPMEFARGDAPQIAEIKYSIRRGTDKDPTSCADTGFIDIYIKPVEHSNLPRLAGAMPFGYRIQPINSNLEISEFAGFREEPSSPTSQEDGYYVFTIVWVEGSRVFQPPVELSVSVSAHDRWGRESPPCVIYISHPGGATRDEPQFSSASACE